MNVVLRDARSLPLIPLLEAIRALIQGWFYEAQNASTTATIPITPWLKKKLTKRLDECQRFIVIPLSMYEFEVRIYEFCTTVNLEAKTWSCRQIGIHIYMQLLRVDSKNCLFTLTVQSITMLLCGENFMQKPYTH